MVRLDQELPATASTGTVINVDLDIPKSFPAVGRIYVGMEMMQVQKSGAKTFSVISRGTSGSQPQFHPKGTPVSDTAYTVSLKISSGAVAPITSEKPLLLYRIDTEPPTSPGNLKGSASASAPAFGSPGVRGTQAQVSASGIFPVSWAASSDLGSGVAQYEIQERVGTSPVWKSIAFIPAKTADGALVTNYTVGGDPRNPTEIPRTSGKFYSYRIRAFDAAGSPSGWATQDVPIFVGSLKDLETISAVSNYPNPFDSRKEKTIITYLLNGDSEVNIKIYDLFGYKVTEMSYGAGGPGGVFGVNNVEWDGTDATGNKVSKGGYVAIIQAKGDKVVSVKRKIGVIH